MPLHYMRNTFPHIFSHPQRVVFSWFLVSGAEPFVGSLTTIKQNIVYFHDLLFIMLIQELILFSLLADVSLYTISLIEVSAVRVRKYSSLI